jgi:hypothetical protein
MSDYDLYSEEAEPPSEAGKQAWIIAGNKGGVGKSLVAKLLVEWLTKEKRQVSIVDGDARTADVYQAFHQDYQCKQFDLADWAGWLALTDDMHSREGDVVINLPDGISAKAVDWFSRFNPMVTDFGFDITALFVINTLPDGLEFYPELKRCFPNACPVKNLYFGAMDGFRHFDGIAEDADRAIILPAMNRDLMGAVRNTKYSFSEYLNGGDNPDVFLLARLALDDWLGECFEALDDLKHLHEGNE